MTDEILFKWTHFSVLTNICSWLVSGGQHHLDLLPTCIISIFEKCHEILYPYSAQFVHPWKGWKLWTAPISKWLYKKRSNNQQAKIPWAKAQLNIPISIEVWYKLAYYISPSHHTTYCQWEQLGFTYYPLHYIIPQHHTKTVISQGPCMHERMEHLTTEHHWNIRRWYVYLSASTSLLPNS